MTQAPTKYGKYPDQFQALEEHAGNNGRSWLNQTRQHAWARFQELGFPTARRGNENWKYTNVAPIANATFQHPLELDAEASVKVGQLREIAPWDKNWVNLVFLDGRYSRSLSTSGAELRPLSWKKRAMTGSKRRSSPGLSLGTQFRDAIKRGFQQLAANTQAPWVFTEG